MEVRALTTIYIGALALSAVLVGALATWVWPMSLETHHVWMLPTLVVLVAVAGWFPFKISAPGDATLITVPLFMAVLLLHPLEAALVSDISFHHPIHCGVFCL